MQPGPSSGDPSRGQECRCMRGRSPATPVRLPSRSRVWASGSMSAAKPSKAGRHRPSSACIQAAFLSRRWQAAPPCHPFRHCAFAPCAHVLRIGKDLGAPVGHTLRSHAAHDTRSDRGAERRLQSANENEAVPTGQSDNPFRPARKANERKRSRPMYEQFIRCTNNLTSNPLHAIRRTYGGTVESREHPIHVSEMVGDDGFEPPTPSV